MCEEYSKGNGIRINILKARQLGSSTFIAAFFFVAVMFASNLKAAIVADQESHAKNIFEKIEFMYKHLDDSNKLYMKEANKANPNQTILDKLTRKPKLRNSRGQTYLATENDSVIEVVVAGVSSGRSTTYQLIHMSEVAFFPNLQKTVTALLSTVDATNKNSVVIYETTANGFNDYKKRWDKAMGGKSREMALFIPWFKDKTKRLPCDELPQMESWLYEKQRKFQLTNSQMMWYWNTYLEIGSKSEVLQEYPFEPTDSFITSGSSVFGTEFVALRKNEVLQEKPLKRCGLFAYEPMFSQDGLSIDLKNIRFIETNSKEVRIYEEPNPTHPYVAVCDPNNGGSDYSAIQVIDNYTGEQVACFSSRDLNLDEVAYQFYCLGKLYNDALLSSEINTGQVVMRTLLKLNYEKIYCSRSSGTNVTFGHRTTLANRDAMIRQFVIAFRNNPKIINDYETLVQMENFQKIDHHDKNGNYTKTKIEATGGMHDDLITSFMAFYEVRGQQECVPIAPVKRDVDDMTLEELEYMLLERRRLGNKKKVNYTGIDWND